jgi:hypothetical protein
MLSSAALVFLDCDTACSSCFSIAFLLLLALLEIAPGDLGEAADLLQDRMLDTFHRETDIDDGQMLAAVFSGIFVLSP